MEKLNEPALLNKTTGWVPSKATYSPPVLPPWDVEANLRAWGIPERYRKAKIDGLLSETPNQAAISQRLKEWATGDVTGSSGLIVIGPPGVGKTWAACAICRHFIEKRKYARYTTTASMISAIRSTWSGSPEASERQVMKRFIEPKLLVIDELGIGTGSDSEWAILHNIIGQRYDAVLPTILISNLAIPDLEQFVGSRLIDRFKDHGRCIVFEGASLRGRLAEMPQAGMGVREVESKHDDSGLIRPRNGS